MKINIIIYTVLTAISLQAYTSNAQEEKRTVLGEMALEESATPIRNGIPGKVPFWNANSIRFIYAPAFEYKEIQGAENYLYKIKCEDKSSNSFKSDNPFSPLSPVWIGMPTGFFNLNVVALNEKGDSIGLAGSGKYYKAAFFNGPYLKPVIPYDKSAEIALDNLLHKDYVEYWLKNKAPDPNYPLYRYPAKIYSALVVGAVTLAKLKPNTRDATRSTGIAVIVADYLLEISEVEGAPLEYFPPTYHGYDEVFNKRPNSLMQHDNTMIPYAVDAGNAYLDLYDLTGNTKYLDAAKRIARTYLKTQLENGSWFLYVNIKTGEPTAENIAIPTSIINYFDRLRRDYKMDGLEKATKAAFEWIMENPVRNFNWQGQFEDIKASLPYANQNREQACDFAIYLFKNNKDILLAEELVRFAEDQFIIWEKPMEIIPDNKSPGNSSKNWIIPSVQEQYAYWMPVTRAAGIMIDAYWQAYETTRKKIYRAKAESIANALTIVQKAHNGDYPTFFTKYPMNVWLNSVVYPAKIMMNLEHELNRNEQ